ncbi:hypothetical protein C1646_664019 [Rhizophagus diaphanus]|nr:hypothetical protein C1646_664019 [Rhizophagus diaphanus] [Rhizophagus sp. MUCL 43196]
MNIEDSFPEDENYLVHWLRTSLIKSWLDIRVERSAEKIHQIFVDAHLNSDQDLLELEDDLPDYYINEEIVIDEKEELDLDKGLNLDTFIINNLEDIIEDSIDNIESNNDEVEESMDENENDIEWDPVAEADEIVDTMLNCKSCDLLINFVVCTIVKCITKRPASEVSPVALSGETSFVVKKGWIGPSKDRSCVSLGTGLHDLQSEI